MTLPDSAVCVLRDNKGVGVRSSRQRSETPPSCGTVCIGERRVHNATETILNNTVTRHAAGRSAFTEEIISENCRTPTEGVGATVRSLQWSLFLV